MRLGFADVVGGEAVLDGEGVTFGGGEIGFDHLRYKLVEAGAGCPAELALGLGGIAEEGFDLGGTEVAGVDGDDDVALLVGGLFVDAGAGPGEVEVEEFGAALDEVAHAVLLAGGDDEVLGFFLLEHEPLHLDVVAGVSPVALGVEVAEEELLLEADLDAGETAGDLAGDKGFAAQGALVIKKDAIAGVDAVGLAVVDDDPEAVHLGDGVGRAGVEGGGLLLGDLLDEAVELGGGGLVELCLLFEAEDADGLEQAEDTEGVGVGGVLGLFEGDGDVGLRGEVVDLVGLDLLHDVNERGGVGHIAVVEDEVAMRDVRVLVDVVDAGGVEERGAPLDAVDLVALAEQELGEVGAVLSGDAGDECLLQNRFSGVLRCGDFTARGAGVLTPLVAGRRGERG